MIPKQSRIIILAVLLYAICFIYARETFMEAVSVTAGLIVEMFQILPPVMIITALLAVWVPAETIRKGLGKGSGVRGTVISLLIGSLSAGPIYAAFPAAATLLSKGASIGNIVIILSSWAVIKVPMFFVEASFLGLRFAVVRFLLTIPSIVVLGWVMERCVRADQLIGQESCAGGDRPSVLSKGDLPNMNCGGCGYQDCEDLSQAIAAGEAVRSACILIVD